MDSTDRTSEISPARTRVLLDRVTTLYEKALADHGPARNWLRDLGVTDAELITSLRIGWCPGTLDNTLPGRSSTRNQLKALGILKSDDSDRLAGCVTFPILSPEGMVDGLLGYRVESGRIISLPALSHGLWNARALLLHSDLLAATNVIDGLILMACGHRNTVAICSSGSVLPAHLQILTERRPNDICFLVKSKQSLGQLAPVFRKAAGEDCILHYRLLPRRRSLAACVLRDGIEAVNRWLIQPPAATPETRKTPASKKTNTQEDNAKENHTTCAACGTSADVALTLDLRQYEVLGLEKASRQLKGTIRVTSSGRLHVDTLDLYSARSRRAMARDLALVFEQPYEIMQADLLRLLRACESWRETADEKGKGSSPVHDMTAQRRKAALAFGRRPDLIEAILADYETCGLVGERHNKLLCYLAAVSRRMDTPLSVLVLSSSGAGKSALQSTTLAFCPPEDVVQATSLTGRALYYQDEEALRHRILAVEEGLGMEASDYAVRTLISARALSVEFVTRERGTGRLKTMSRRIPGPTSVFCTVTDPNVDAETRSRFFVLGVDETREQTGRILLLQRERHTLDGLTGNVEAEAIRQRHRDFQRLLKPMAVINPYAKELTYEDDRLQARRDQPKYLNLIRAVAFLHQMTRPVKHQDGTEYIEAEVEDIGRAHGIFAGIYGTTLDELSTPARQLLSYLRAFMIEKAEALGGSSISGSAVFTRREVRERIGWNRTRLHRHMRELMDLEYVVQAPRVPGNLPTYRLLYSGEGLSGERFKPGLRLPSSMRKKDAVQETGPLGGSLPVQHRFRGGS